MTDNSSVQPSQALRYGVTAATGLTFGALVAGLSILLLAVAAF